MTPDDKTLAALPDDADAAVLNNQTASEDDTTSPAEGAESTDVAAGEKPPVTAYQLYLDYLQHTKEKAAKNAETRKKKKRKRREKESI